MTQGHIKILWREGVTSKTEGQPFATEWTDS